MAIITRTKCKGTLRHPYQLSTDTDSPKSLQAPGVARRAGGASSTRTHTRHSRPSPWQHEHTALHGAQRASGHPAAAVEEGGTAALHPPPSPSSGGGSEGSGAYERRCTSVVDNDINLSRVIRQEYLSLLMFARLQVKLISYRKTLGNINGCVVKWRLTFLALQVRIWIRPYKSDLNKIATTWRLTHVFTKQNSKSIQF